HLQSHHTNGITLSTYPDISSVSILEPILFRIVYFQLELRQTPNKDMRRYERPHINEVWCGDSSAGPRLTDSDGKNTGTISLP
ncbi:MAG: hypothetical protein ACLTNN_00005, partial [Blautia sp.]